MPSKVDAEVTEHHARADEASPETGDEKVAVTPAPERNKSENSGLNTT
jgi:hypothetical protein